MLTLLPLPETTIQSLLRGELQFGQIPVEHVMTYHPDEHHSLMIVSAAAKTGQEESILLVARRAFRDLAKHSILVEDLYALADEQEDSPLMRLIACCAFTPLDETGKQWKLRPFYRKFQPSVFIQEYRSSVINNERKLKNMLLDETRETVAIEALREFFNKEKHESEKRQRNLIDLVLKRIRIDPDGRIVRMDLDQQKQRNIFVRPIRDDHDIEAALLINMSLFGTSKRYTLSQLVEQRRPWIAKNPDIYQVLEVEGRVIGYVLILPLSQPALDSLLQGTVRASDISVDDLQEYHTDKGYNLLLHTLVFIRVFRTRRKNSPGFIF